MRSTRPRPQFVENIEYVGHVTQISYHGIKMIDMYTFYK